VEPPAAPPAEAIPPVGGTPVPAEPLAGAEGAYQPLVPEEEVRAEVQSAVLQSQSLGLLDADGNQLNPHVPSDAVSLLPEDLAAHVSLTAGGGFRTIGDVIDFLAAFDVRLAATGRTITVEDILPDLQSYVSWSFDDADEPQAGLGLTLGSGPMLVRPETAPTMSENTPISSIASVMMLADLLIGVGDSGDAGAMGERWEDCPRSEVRLAALADELPGMLAQGDAATAALTKIRGFITRIELDPNFVNLFIGAERLGMQRRLLALFDCQNRMSVRLYESRFDMLFPVEQLRAQWRDDGWWINAGQPLHKRDTFPAVARVAIRAGDEWSGEGLPSFRYSAQLWSRGTSLAAGWAGELVELLMAETTSFVGPMKTPPDALIVAAMGVLAAESPGTGPLVEGADARLGAGHSGTPTQHRLVDVASELQFSIGVSRAPGQAMPARSRLGVAFLGINAKVDASEFLGFWMRNVEPMRVMGLTPAEDEALVRLATDRLLDAPRICCPIFLENATEEEPAEVASTDLLGEHRIAPQAPWAVATHLKVAPDGTVSGFCALNDSRANAQWTWREILGTFSGRLTERNPQFEAQRESGEGRNALGRLEVGKLEATGTWRGVAQPPDARAALQRALTGTVSVAGTLMLDGNDRYVAEGHVQFHEDDDWLSWTASAATWDEGLAAALQFEREHNFKSPFPTGSIQTGLRDSKTGALSIIVIHTLTLRVCEMSRGLSSEHLLTLVAGTHSDA